MALFQKMALEVLFSETETGAIKLFERAETLKDDSTILEVVSHRFTLANNAVDEAVALGKLTTGKAIAVFVDRQTTIKIDDEAVLLGKTPTSGGFFVLSDTSFSTIKLSNASGEDTQVSMVIGGA